MILQRQEQLEQVAAKKKSYETRCKIQERKKAEEQKVVDDETQHKKEFFSELEKSKDLADNIPGLVDFLQRYTGATGVYLGRL